MNVQALTAELDQIEQDRSLDVETNLAGRTRALEVIRLIDELVRLRGRSADLSALRARAEVQRRRLVALNNSLFQRVRGDIRNGQLRSVELRRLLDNFTNYTTAKGQPHFGPDGLDDLLNGVFRLDHPPHPAQTPQPEMIHLEHTPARVILDLVDHVDLAPTDLFYDLGAGLGQVVILIHLLTGIAARGIEIDSAYCTYAGQCAADLGLSNVDFVQADARQADYTAGTIFFMFSPFKGKMLQEVLARLAVEAQRRPLKLCTYGPCTPEAFGQPWLKNINDSGPDEFKLACFASIVHNAKHETRNTGDKNDTQSLWLRRRRKPAG